MIDTTALETETVLATQPVEVTAAVAERMAEMFAMLSDPNRIRIIAALAHRELNVGQIVELVGLSESATSHQLRLLRTQRLVRARKEGRQVFYRLDDEHIHDLLDRAVEHLSHE